MQMLPIFHMKALFCYITLREAQSSIIKPHQHTNIWTEQHCKAWLLLQEDWVCLRRKVLEEADTGLWGSWSRESQKWKEGWRGREEKQKKKIFLKESLLFNLEVVLKYWLNILDRSHQHCLIFWLLT